MEPTHAPYGNWKSAISAELASQESSSGINHSGFMDLSVDQLGEYQDQDVYWTDTVASEGGRSILFSYNMESGKHRKWTPADFSVRTRVHEYGGGAFVVVRGVVIFSNMNDQRLYLQTAHDVVPTPLTAARNHFYADASYSATHNRLFYVREDHEKTSDPEATESAPSEVETTLVQVDPTSGEVKVVVHGADFYSSPRVSPDGRRLAWLEWQHPNMPWDDTRLLVAQLNAEGLVESSAIVLVQAPPKRQLSVMHPTWTADGGILYGADHEEYWDLYHVDSEGQNRRRIFTRGTRDTTDPPWVFNGCCFWYQRETNTVVVNSPGDGMLEVSISDCSQRTISAEPDRAPVVRGGPSGRRLFIAVCDFKAFPSLVSLEPGPSGPSIRVLTRSCGVALNPADISVPRHVEFDTTDGGKAFAFYYPPRNAAFRPPAGSAPPPLIVEAHGGPTSSASTRLRLSVQFWTTRGFALLDVDYRGSTGYGRRYREALRGKWGIYDVDDCCAAVQYLVRENLADRERIAIHGGSAGGYTTLSCLAFREVFAAGASHYGVADLGLLVEDTHKFESRYLESLIGPYPAAKHLFTQRSPLHSLDRFSCPIVFFQGDEDKIVPPNQAELMFTSLREKGIVCAYLLFPGEQHGFRKRENIVRALEAELYFFAIVFGLEPETGPEVLEIQNFNSARRRRLTS